ncbi:uncharacterized protein Dvir_GJ26316, partial [Drosophila virilis]
CHPFKIAQLTPLPRPLLSLTHISPHHTRKAKELKPKQKQDKVNPSTDLATDKDDDACAADDADVDDDQADDDDDEDDDEQFMAELASVTTDFDDIAQYTIAKPATPMPTAMPANTPTLKRKQFTIVRSLTPLQPANSPHQQLKHLHQRRVETPPTVITRVPTPTPTLTSTLTSTPTSTIMATPASLPRNHFTIIRTQQRTITPKHNTPPPLFFKSSKAQTSTTLTSTTSTTTTTNTTTTTTTTTTSHSNEQLIQFSNNFNNAAAAAAAATTTTTTNNINTHPTTTTTTSIIRKLLTLQDASKATVQQPATMLLITDVNSYNHQQHVAVSNSGATLRPLSFISINACNKITLPANTRILTTTANTTTPTLTVLTKAMATPSNHSTNKANELTITATVDSGNKTNKNISNNNNNNNNNINNNNNNNNNKSISNDGTTILMINSNSS